MTSSGFTDYGQTYMCPGPGCLKDNFRAYKSGKTTLKNTGISEKVQTFKNFKMMPGVKATYQAFKALADGEAAFRLLLAYGGVGNGKTHLCNALARELHAAGIPTQYYAAPDMFSMLRQGINNHTVDNQVEKLKNIDALIIDDFKVENFTMNWEAPKLEEIIDARYREIRLTVLVVNQDLDKIPERVMSRFFEPDIGKVVLNDAVDYRTLRK